MTHILFIAYPGSSKWDNLHLLDRVLAGLSSSQMLYVFPPVNYIHCFFLNVFRSHTLSFYLKNECHFHICQKFEVMKFLFDSLNWRWPQPFIALFRVSRKNILKNVFKIYREKCLSGKGTFCTSLGFSGLELYHMPCSFLVVKIEVPHAASSPAFSLTEKQPMAGERKPLG